MEIKNMPEKKAEKILELVKDQMKEGAENNISEELKAELTEKELDDKLKADAKNFIEACIDEDYDPDHDDQKDNTELIREGVERATEGLLSIEDYTKDDKGNVTARIVTGIGGPTIYHVVEINDDEYKIIDAHYSHGSTKHPKHDGWDGADILHLEYDAPLIYMTGLQTVKEA